MKKFPVKEIRDLALTPYCFWHLCMETLFALSSRFRKRGVRVRQGADRDFIKVSHIWTSGNSTAAIPKNDSFFITIAPPLLKVHCGLMREDKRLRSRDQMNPGRLCALFGLGTISLSGRGASAQADPKAITNSEQLAKR